MSFVHLQVHSHYSLLEAIGSPAHLAKQAHALGMDTLALTDYNGLYGAIEFIKACKKENITPLIGVELGLVHDRTNKPKGEQAGTIVLLASSLTGYQHLLKLVSEAHLTGFHGMPRIDFSLLTQWGEWLICLLGGPDSWIWKQLALGEPQDKIHEQISYLQQLVGQDNVLLTYLVQSYNDIRGLQALNTTLLDFAQARSLQILPVSNVHYVHADDKDIYEVALAIKDGKRMFDADRRTKPWQRHLMSEAEIKTILLSHGIDETRATELCDATTTLASRIDLDIPLGKALFPSYEPDAEMHALYDKWKEKLVVG